MNIYLKKILPHFIIVLGFIVASVAYFSPVLQGKEIFQSDIVQYTGMAKQQNDFRAENDQEPYWTDAAFGGMPTYQLGANYPHNYVKEFDRALRFLPRPADYLFLYFIGFYILLLVLKVDYKLAFLGALAFGFSTYLIIILGVGHNAKAHAIAYMPMVLGGIILCFRQKLVGGFLLLAIAMGLEIMANHPQMTYYLLLLVLVLGIAFLVDAIRKNVIKNYFKALGVMVLAVILAIGLNATSLLATQEYSEFSTRGDTGITINPDGTPKTNTGLDYDYITTYSYGKLESFNLFIPRFMGGSSTENIGEDAEIANVLRQMGASPSQAKEFTESAPTYWGDQPFVGAPAYIGATVIFLFFVALFLVKGKNKWWIVSGSILALLLSWGKNFEFLTNFFIEYVPLYNKFRAVSSIQVIIELCVPALAIFGLAKFFNPKVGRDEKQKALKWGTIITGGLALVFILFKNVLFNFSGAQDAAFIQQLGPEFVRALKEDRAAILTADAIRSLIFVLLSAGILYLFLKQKIQQNWVVAGFAVLILVDLVGVDKRYVNNDDFVQARVMNQPFQANEADRQVMQDTTHYRVFDVSEDPFNTGKTSYFHNSIGGYHAAKPGRMQDLMDFYISENDMQVLNMLNTKFFIFPTEEGIQYQENTEAFGNAWTVDDVKWAESANEAILALGETDLSQTAVINSEYEDLLSGFTFQKNQETTIELVKYQPNHLKYKFSSPSNQLVVFSEIYYPQGWNVFIDGEKVPHFRANYVLRALKVPAGDHEIVFKFEPEVVKTGSTIALASSILFGLLLLGGLFYKFRRSKSSEEN